MCAGFTNVYFVSLYMDATGCFFNSQTGCSHVWSRLLMLPQMFHCPGRLPNQNLQSFLFPRTEKTRDMHLKCFYLFFVLTFCCYWGQRGFVHFVEHLCFFWWGLSLQQEEEKNVREKMPYDQSVFMDIRKYSPLGRGWMFSYLKQRKTLSLWDRCLFFVSKRLSMQDLMAILVSSWAKTQNLCTQWFKTVLNLLSLLPTSTVLYFCFQRWASNLTSWLIKGTEINLQLFVEQLHALDDFPWQNFGTWFFLHLGWHNLFMKEFM